VASLNFTELPLKGAYTIDLDKREDDRGFFARYWCKNEFAKFGLDTNIVQINNSLSKTKGTIRGLHFQRPPKAETKIIRCFKGSIWDVIIDIRLDSPTYGEWYGYELNEENRTMMYVPKGFAHGFQTLVDDVELLYLHSEFYSKNNEAGLFYNDEDIAIDWPLSVTEITSRDKSHPKLRDIEPIKL
jgi:dTDP-4-dehydrorhamnose 3,5-epimerase